MKTQADYVADFQDSVRELKIALIDSEAPPLDVFTNVVRTGMQLRTLFNMSPEALTELFGEVKVNDTGAM